MRSSLCGLIIFSKTIRQCVTTDAANARVRGTLTPEQEEAIGLNQQHSSGKRLICIRLNTQKWIGVAREFYDKREQMNAAIVAKEFHRQEYGELGLPTSLFEEGDDVEFSPDESEEEEAPGVPVARSRTIWTEEEARWIQSWVNANPKCRDRINWKKCAEDIRLTTNGLFDIKHINPTSLREKYKRVKKVSLK